MQEVLPPVEDGLVEGDGLFLEQLQELGGFALVADVGGFALLVLRGCHASDRAVQLRRAVAGVDVDGLAQGIAQRLERPHTEVSEGADSPFVRFVLQSEAVGRRGARQFVQFKILA